MNINTYLPVSPKLDLETTTPLISLITISNPQSSHQQPSHKTIDQTITEMPPGSNEETVPKGEAPPRFERSDPNTSSLINFSEKQCW